MTVDEAKTRGAAGGRRAGIALCLAFALCAGAAVAADAPKSPAPAASGPSAQGAAPPSTRELIEKRKAKRREAAKKAAEIPPIDINTAKREELKKLQGVDDAMADRIIAGRPYQTKAELVTKSGMPMGVYQQNRKQVIAKPPAKAKAAGKQNPKK
jgi:DNA uptake protein ComE-like DNA-binding protein